LTRPVLIISTLFLLTGCNAHVAGLAGYVLVEPVAKIAWHGGKSAYEAASTAWMELSTEDEGEKE
jgi:hypothetical protein